ncbi:acyltransferase family protein [Porphyromonas sp.]
MSKQRLLSLDALKGIAILMVIWGHFYLWADSDVEAVASYLHRFVLAVHMSLFVLIAGYLSQRKVDSYSSLKRFFQDKFVRLILPVLLWYPFWRLWHDGRVEWVGILRHQYWFTLHLFIYFVLFLLQRTFVDALLRLCRVDRKSWAEAILHMCIMISIYYLIHDVLLHLIPTAADIFPIVRTRLTCLYPYFVIGWLVGRFDLLDKLRSSRLVVVSFALFVLCVGYLVQEKDWAGYIDHYLGYGLWDMYRLMALSFFVVLLNVMHAVTERGGRLSKWLVLLGQWSLPIYFVHYFFLPEAPGMRAWLCEALPWYRLSMELAIGGIGTLVALLPSLVVVYCIRLNPYLDFALFGEKGRLKK